MADWVEVSDLVLLFLLDFFDMRLITAGTLGKTAGVIDRHSYKTVLIPLLMMLMLLSVVLFQDDGVFRGLLSVLIPTT